MQLLALFAVLLVSAPAFASPVYSWEDEQGIKHYASKPNSPSAKEAKLPEIMRAEVKLTEKRLVNCDKHGGVNCQAGTDVDGSVICFDGFKDAANRFLSSCSNAKLEISQISPVDEQGVFFVIVRNKRSIPAEKPKVLVRLLDGSKGALTGPDSLEPFGNAEFTFVPPSTVRTSPTVSPGELELSCDNCQ